MPTTAPSRLKRWLLGMFAPAKSTTKSPRAKASYRPRFEGLEDRTVPAAVRILPGITANSLAANDDGSTGRINLGFNVNFFGVQANSVFINNNGNITFTNALGQFTPTGISTTVTQPMIAPFFADVDTRGTGSNLVQYGQTTCCGRPAFGINWVNVGYFASHTNLLNSFQLLLIERGDTGVGNFDIEMNYDRIVWETGDASGGNGGLGGISAEAGYTNGLPGAQRVSFEFTGSRVNGALLDNGPNALTRNAIAATTLGRYHFFVRGGQVVAPPIPVPTETPTQQVTFVDITNTTRSFLPIRYTARRGNNLSGLITFRRNALPPPRPITTITILPPANTVEACLDEVSSSTTTPNTPQTTTVTPPVPPTPTPITIVITHLPRGLRAMNRTGTTSAGHAYFTISNSHLQPGENLRMRLHLHNRLHRRMTLFYVNRNFHFRVIAGPFDPAAF